MQINVKSIVLACCPSALKPMLTRIENSPLGYRLAKGVFWSMAGAVISRGLTFAALVLVARLLGREVFGKLEMVQSSIIMFGVLAGFGLALTATKHVAEFCQSDPERAGHIIGLSGLFAMITGGLISLGLFIFAPWLAEHTLNDPSLAGVLRIACLVLFFNAMNGAQTGALAGFEAFKSIAHVNFFIGLISFPVLICGAWFGGLVGTVWALAINFGFNWLLNHLALRKEARRYGIPLTFRHCSQELPILWKFSMPAVLSACLAGPVGWACKAMLVNQPNGFSELGTLAVALIFQNMLLFATGMLNAPLLSMLSNVGSAKSSKLETANILSSWLLGLLPAIPLLCFPEIAEMLFGGEYQGYSFKVAFAIVVFYTCILTYRSGLLRVLISKNLLWWGLANNLFWAAVLLPTAYFLTRWGAVGLAASFAIAYVCNSIVFVPVYMKQAKVPRELLISKETGLVWLVIISLVVAVFCDVPIAYRIAAFPISLGLIGWSLTKIWHRNAS